MALLNQAKQAVLNAPFERDGWGQAIELVARACGAPAANLVGFGGPAAFSVNLFSGPDSARAERYFARPALWGQCNWRVNSAGRPLSIQHDAHYAIYRKLAKTSDYDDAVSDLDMQFGCQSALISDSRTFLGLALLRGRREGPCDADSLARFSELIRHVHRAVRVQIALAGEAAELMMGDLGAMTSAMVLVDRYGCVCALTPAAEPLADEDGPFRLCGLTFQLRDPEENRRIQAAMTRLLTKEDVAGSGVFQMRAGRTHADPTAPWGVSLVRLPRREHGLGFDPHFALTFRRLRLRPPTEQPALLEAG